MNKEEHDKILDFVNSDDYMLLNNYISKPYEETIVEQDKEIERLNKECDIYMKIATKRENIIDELEKEINNQLNMTRKFDKYNEGYFNATLNYYNKLKELKEGK